MIYRLCMMLGLSLLISTALVRPASAVNAEDYGWGELAGLTDDEQAAEDMAPGPATRWRAKRVIIERTYDDGTYDAIIWVDPSQPEQCGDMARRVRCGRVVAAGYCPGTETPSWWVYALDHERATGTSVMSRAILELGRYGSEDMLTTVPDYIATISVYAWKYQYFDVGSGAWRIWPCGSPDYITLYDCTVVRRNYCPDGRPQWIVTGNQQPVT
jgi:hypothetical protein